MLRAGCMRPASTLCEAHSVFGCAGFEAMAEPDVLNTRQKENKPQQLNEQNNLFSVTPQYKYIVHDITPAYFCAPQRTVNHLCFVECYLEKMVQVLFFSCTKMPPILQYRFCYVTLWIC